MTLVSQGPFGGVTHPAVNGDGVRCGVKQLLTTPSFVSCNYTAAYHPELAANALSPLRRRHCRPRCTLQLHPVDKIKAIKSAEEQELIRHDRAKRPRPVPAPVP